MSDESRFPSYETLTSEQIELLCRLPNSQARLRGRLNNSAFAAPYVPVAWRYLVELYPLEARVLYYRQLQTPRMSVAEICRAEGIAASAVKYRSEHALATFVNIFRPARVESLYLPPSIVHKLTRHQFVLIRDLAFCSRFDPRLVHTFNPTELDEIAVALGLRQLAFRDEAVMTVKPEGGLRLQTVLSEGGQDLRLIRVLYKQGVVWVDELLELGWNEIQAIPTIGPEMAKYLQDRLWEEEQITWPRKVGRQ